jgi:xanthine dehydrogenase YagT iron-sulfur-binding subunit
VACPRELLDATGLRKIDNGENHNKMTKPQYSADGSDSQRRDQVNLLLRPEASVQPDKNQPSGGVSRRTFLQGLGATSVVSGVLASAPGQQAEAATEVVADFARPVGPGEVKFSLNINGQETTLSVEPRTTLLDALRTRVGLTGSKKVCDRGTCGACTVLQDGRPIYACSTLAIECRGSKITTIEGLGTEDELSPVQAAFVKHDAQQCGFCTPGFVVACTGFLQDNPDPTPEQIRTGLGGNLCRCGTYEGIKRAVLDAAKATRGDG